MNIKHNEKLREKLAAEYVLGTLQGGARRRFETWLPNDAALRRSVAEWQDRLHPLAEFSPSVAPAPHVWQAIQQQLSLPASNNLQDRSSFWRNLREDLSFWRGLGLTSTAVATILVAVLATRQPEQVAYTPSYVATLADDKAQPIAVITADAKRRQLTVKMLAVQTLASDKSMELWAIPKNGAPRSLGLLASNGMVQLPMPDNLTSEAIPLLAVSLEPKGGSPNPNGPTGPVLFKGAWVPI